MTELFTDPDPLLSGPAVLFEAPACLLSSLGIVGSSIMRDRRAPSLENSNTQD